MTQRHEIPDHVHETVNEHLDQIEAERDVHVVYAVAHGSHAWGLASETSDYDVKGVYIPRDLASYARVNDQKEVITFDSGDYEYELWDINKFGQLLYNSNDQAIDALRSPIVYRETMPEHIDELREFVVDNYNPIALYHKYRSSAYNNHRKHLSDHLTSNRDNTYPIIDRRPEQFVVRNEYTGNTMTVPREAVEGDLSIQLTYDQVDLSDKGDPTPCPECGAVPGPYETTFTDTKTRQNVKRNLIVLKNGMHAVYLRQTGEHGDHTLPSVDFPTFLSDQAPDYIDPSIIASAKRLVDAKRNGDNDTVGDLAPDHIASPDKQIDPDIHNTGKPDIDRLNELLTNIISEIHA